MLANVALHGLEETLTRKLRIKSKIIVVRYADDLVALCGDLKTLTKWKEGAETWLAEMGLRLKPSKTRITHTLKEHEGNVGFDFLGFNIRQYPVGQYRTSTYRGKPGFKTLIKPSRKAVKQHQDKIRETIRQHRGAPQAALIAALNPIIRGWAAYHRTGVAKQTFSKMDQWINHALAKWAQRRHPRKSRAWRFRRYWQRQATRMTFSAGTDTRIHYADTPIVRHVKVRGDKSPYDGDWVYWSARMGHDPTKPNQITKLLKKQQGRCTYCGLRFMTEDVIEVHHRDGDRSNNWYSNLTLLHGHCHDQVHGEQHQ